MISCHMRLMQFYQVIQMLFVILMIVSSVYGFGQHTTDITAEDIRKATKIEVLAQFFISLAMGLSKTAVAAFLLRIIVVVWYESKHVPKFTKMLKYSQAKGNSLVLDCYYDGLVFPTGHFMLCPMYSGGGNLGRTHNE